MSAATGLDFRHSNIKNFDDVMPVSAGMKRKSEERLDAAIRREEEEEERLLDAAIRRVEEKMKEEEMSVAAAAAAARMKEMKEAEAAAAAARRKEMQEAAAVTARRMEMAVASGAWESVPALKRMAFLINAESKMSCVRLCIHVGCVKSVHAKGVCIKHGTRCSHVGCDKNPHISGVCKEHGSRCSHVGCDKCRGAAMWDATNVPI
jgi:hypothetical protein